MRFRCLFFFVFCSLAACGGSQTATEQAPTCPVRPTTSAKKMMAAGQTWVIITVLYPLDKHVSCEGEFEGGVPFRNLLRIASMVQGKGDIHEGEYYGVGIQDCVCEGNFGYTSYMRADTPVIYCLSPEQAAIIENKRKQSSSRLN